MHAVSEIVLVNILFIVRFASPLTLKGMSAFVLRQLFSFFIAYFTQLYSPKQTGVEKK